MVVVGNISILRHCNCGVLERGRGLLQKLGCSIVLLRTLKRLLGDDCKLGTQVAKSTGNNQSSNITHAFSLCSWNIILNYSMSKRLCMVSSVRN